MSSAADPTSSAARPTDGEPTWPSVLGRLIAGTDLSAADTTWVMDRVLTAEATAAQLAGFLVALRAKGETPEEIRGLADAMLAHAHRVEVPGPAVDVVGTGGDQAHTVNISTMAALVTAAAGVPVVKHGGRAASSKAGTADVLEALGVAIDLPGPQIAACVREVGIAFCFAPVFHPAMRHAAGPRRELGVPTAMNVLGPLSNPAQPAAGLVGCADRRLAPIVAEVFGTRGMSVLVVRGDDGLDELTTTTTSTVWRAERSGTVVEESLDPSAFGIAAAGQADLRGGTPEQNAQTVRDLVGGKPGPVRDAVLLNAAGALAAHEGIGPAGLAAAVSEALPRAAAAVDNGAAAELLTRWTETSQRLSTG